MKRVWIVLGLMSWLLLSGCNAATPAAKVPLMSTADIEAAVRAGLPDLGVPVDELKIEVNGMDEEYARAAVTTDDPVNPIGMTVFLKQEEGQWRVLTYGSGFEGEHLDSLGIPHSLSQPPAGP